VVDLILLCNVVQTNQIAALLRPFAELDQTVLEQTSIYIDLLIKWNARVNLTAVREPAEIVQRHFGESFFAAAHLLGSEAKESVIDLGSGAGFPGLPIAMLRPLAHVTLIESNGKKAAFLNEVIRTLKLGNTTVFKERAETYPGTADLVTMRAVEGFSNAARLALKLVSPQCRSLKEFDAASGLITSAPTGAELLSPPRKRWERLEILHEPRRGGTEDAIPIVDRHGSTRSLSERYWVSPGGKLALMIGSSQVDKALALDHKIKWQPPVPIPGGHSRILLVGIKLQKVD
jgi:16S rRNA (guanine527-N7)-methyltransferase